jgi:hypothetical protein
MKSFTTSFSEFKTLLENQDHGTIIPSKVLTDLIDFFNHMKDKKEYILSPISFKNNEIGFSFKDKKRISDKDHMHFGEFGEHWVGTLDGDDYLSYVFLNNGYHESIGNIKEFIKKHF